MAIVLGIWSIWRTRQLNRRITAALGTKDRDIEATLVEHLKRVEQVDNKLDNLSVIYQDLKSVAEMSSQKISVVRFNPFGDTGGDQSFALAVLDAHNSGYVLTSIHGREGNRSYVKPIDYGKSKYTLSVEEKQALAQASMRVPITKSKGE